MGLKQYQDASDKGFKLPRAWTFTFPRQRSYYLQRGWSKRATSCTACHSGKTSGWFQDAFWTPNHEYCLTSCNHGRSYNGVLSPTLYRSQWEKWELTWGRKNREESEKIYRYSDCNNFRGMCPALWSVFKADHSRHLLCDTNWNWFLRDDQKIQTYTVRYNRKRLGVDNILVAAMCANFQISNATRASTCNRRFLWHTLYILIPKTQPPYLIFSAAISFSPESLSYFSKFVHFR